MYSSKVLSIIKSIYLNFRVFNYKTAIKLPILVSYNTKLVGIKKNSIVIDDSLRFGDIRIGFGGIDVVQGSKTSLLRVDKGGKIIFSGTAQFSSGISIRIGPNGRLNIGNNFAANKKCSLLCDGNMRIGNDVLLGWEVNIRDSDGHVIYDNITKIKNPIQKNVTIGNHVWIASYVDILKGTEIMDNSVIAYKSCVLSKFDKSNCIIGGYPAKILRENINWEK